MREYDSQIIRVLLVEDDLGDTLWIQELLEAAERSYLKVDLHHCSRLAAALEYCAAERPDAVLLDLGLPDSQGMITLKSLLDVTPDLPVVVLTGLADEEFGAAAVQKGAQDYLIKGQINQDQLVRSLRYALERQRAEEALRASHRFLEIVQNHEDINSLLNAFLFEIKKYTGCEAAGIRVLDADGRIPYQAYQGFSRQFYEMESPLSLHSDQCMCINVIKGTCNPELPFYTPEGSFYMNGTSQFLAKVSEEDKGSTRNMCNQVGYESVALVPFRRGSQILGLIHVADHRDNMVPLSKVKILEQAGMQLGSAFLRLQAEEALRYSEASLAEAQRIARLGNWEWDTARNELIWSDEVYRIFGLVPQEFQPTHEDFLSFIHPDDLMAVNHQVAEGIRFGKYGPYDYRIIRRDGSVRSVYAHGETSFNQEGRPLRMRGTVQDITELKQAEEALRHARDELEQRVKERTVELERSNATIKKSEENLRYLTSQLLSVQEKERKRMAMELHEGLGQSMTALKMYLRAIQRHLPPEAVRIKVDFEGAQNLLREMIEDVRHISRGLSPALLRNLGLNAALKHLLDEFSKYQEMTIKADIDDIQNLFSPQTEINLFRIFQESLNNISKHARATQVSVTIARQDGRVNFLIKDNGVGFDLEQIRHGERADKGMGLAAMDERLRMIGAQLNIASQKGRGSEIGFSIPTEAK